MSAVKKPQTTIKVKGAHVPIYNHLSSSSFFLSNLSAGESVWPTFLQLENLPPLFHVSRKNITTWKNTPNQYKFFNKFKQKKMLVGFYSISTYVGYLMPNYICIYIYIGCGSKTWKKILNDFFCLICSILKKRYKSKFSWIALLFKHSFIKIQFNMRETKKRNDKESMICLTPKPSQKNFRNN